MTRLWILFLFLLTGYCGFCQSAENELTLTTGYEQFLSKLKWAYNPTLNYGLEFRSHDPESRWWTAGGVTARKYTPEKDTFYYWADEDGDGDKDGVGEAVLSDYKMISLNFGGGCDARFTIDLKDLYWRNGLYLSLHYLTYEYEYDSPGRDFGMHFAGTLYGVSGVSGLVYHVTDHIKVMSLFRLSAYFPSNHNIGTLGTNDSPGLGDSVYSIDFGVGYQW